jgi:hypothetical protein
MHFQLCWQAGPGISDGKRACPPGNITRRHLVHPPMQQPCRQVKKLRVGVPQLPACPHHCAQLVHWQALFSCRCCSAAAAAAPAASIPRPVAAVIIKAAATAAGAAYWLATAAAGAVQACLQPAGQLLGDGPQEGLVLGGSQRGQSPQKSDQRLHSTAARWRRDTWTWLSAGWQQVGTKL